jgi:molybdopterin/thiamine biosynthesis adenylyltransferase/rhodanese-related sulfurtransferase
MQAQLTADELAMYARQLKLPGMTIETQLKLKRARVLVVGAGGLGSPVLLYLAGAGIGKIGIMDGDSVSVSNLHRQVLFDQRTVGTSKAEAARDRLLALNSNISIEVHQLFLSRDNAAAICAQYDVVVDGTDNFAAKYLLDEICGTLRIPLVYASKSYRDLYPAPPSRDMAPNCSEAGVIGVLPGILGTLQANEVIKIVTGIGEPISSKLLVFDALTCNTRLLKFKHRKSVLPVERIDDRCVTPDFEISAAELLDWLKQGKAVSLIDVRERHEHQAAAIGGTLIPLATLPERLSDLPQTALIVCYCQSGGRSAKAVRFLKSKEYRTSYSLRGGMNVLNASLIEEIACSI